MMIRTAVFGDTPMRALVGLTSPYAPAAPSAI